jgi:hypothetical protein
MSTESATIVQRLWNYCNVLRDDGVSYGDYVEQLTYFLFLKMDDERVRELGEESAISAEYNWASLRGKSGTELENHYRTILTELGQGSGLIPIIFRKAQNRIQDPAKLRRESQNIVMISGPRPATSSSISYSTCATCSTSTRGQRSSCLTTCSLRAAPARRCAAACCTSATCTPCCGSLPAFFYAQGVKANVLFFDRRPARETPWTRQLWIYDLRTNQHFTLKQSPLTRAAGQERPDRAGRQRPQE